MGRKIELTREIAAPPARVFDALTDADELSRWWTTRAESDARAGGAFDYRWDFEEGAGREDHRQSGTYGEFVANERLSYPWRADGSDTTVAIELAASGAGTTLRLVHMGWEEEGENTQQSTEMHEQGWGFFLDNLKSYLETGEDRRSAMGLKTPAAATA